MRSAYIDTNVLIAKYKRGDAFHQSCSELFEKEIVICIYSPIVLIELASVFAKEMKNIELKLSTKGKKIYNRLTLVGKVQFATRYILQTNKLEYYSTESTEIFSVDSDVFTIPSIFRRAWELAGKTELRTLDNLHIAMIYHMVYIERRPLDYFVTCDEGIIKKKRQIYELLNVTTLTPDLVLELETS